MSGLNPIIVAWDTERKLINMEAPYKMHQVPIRVGILG